MMQEWARDTWVRSLLIVILVLGAIALAAYAYNAYTEARQIDRGMSTISVAGTSEQFIEPNIVTFSFSVEATEKDATLAKNTSAEAVNTIIAYLKEQGVEEKDIKTESYNLQPKTEYQTAICPQWGSCPPGKEIVVGYIVNQTIAVKVREMEKASDLVSGVVEQGATNVSSLTFTIDDMEAAREAVRVEAIADAKAKAVRLADSLDVRLGRLMSYYENGPGYPIPYAGGDSAMNQVKSMDSMNSAPSLPPGENKVVSNVSLVYEIR